MHHLLDVWDVREAASVAEYQRLARAAVDDVRGRGSVALLVGGSGLYVRAVLDEMDFPGTDPEVRARLEAELEEVGAGAMHVRLAAVDPVAAQAILPSNGRRIVRALEVVEITGRAVRRVAAARRGRRTPRCRSGSTCRARSSTRASTCGSSGCGRRAWSTRYAGLSEDGLREGLTASRALGYAQVLRFLDGGCTEEEALVETQRATRRFARRQDTWFRRDERIVWIPYDADDLLEQALRLVR